MIWHRLRGHLVEPFRVITSGAAVALAVLVRPCVREAVATRARAGVYHGVEGFGHRSRAYVGKDSSGLWKAARRGQFVADEVFSSWAEALAYALGKDETDDRETE